MEKPAETLAEMRERHRRELEGLMNGVRIAPMLDVLREVSEDTGIPMDILRGPTRRQPEAFARQIAMWRMREEGHSLPKIGRFLNRDHTTVLYGCRRVEQKLGAAQ